jgi:hypothetical protein
MKKKILLGIAVVAVAAVTAVNVNIALQSNDLSALSLENVEALAGEDDIPRDSVKVGGWHYMIIGGKNTKVCIPPGNAC